MCVHTSHWPYVIHFLHCAHGNEHTWTCDVICNTFDTIAQDVDFHMGWKQRHMLSSTTFNSSCWQVDIVFTKDEIHILVNIVIADPMQVALLF
jgi:hypothetical protein